MTGAVVSDGTVSHSMSTSSIRPSSLSLLEFPTNRISIEVLLAPEGSDEITCELQVSLPSIKYEFKSIKVESEVFFQYTSRVSVLPTELSPSLSPFQ